MHIHYLCVVTKNNPLVKRKFHILDKFIILQDIFLLISKINNTFLITKSKQEISISLYVYNK